MRIDKFDKEVLVLVKLGFRSSLTPYKVRRGVEHCRMTLSLHHLARCRTFVKIEAISMTEIDGTERYHIPKKQELIGYNSRGFIFQNVASEGAR